MSHAFAKDSRACGACVSWAGERVLAEDNTLVHVTRYSVEGECRTASSQDYRKVTKAYHTCATWAPLPQLRAHGGRPERPPAAPPPAAPPPRATPPGATPPGATPPGTAPPGTAAGGTLTAAASALAPGEPPPPPGTPEPCQATPLDLDRLPPAARVLYGYWHRLKRERPLPAAREIDTAQIRDCVSRLSLMEPAGDGRDFVYRACGRAVQRRLGRRPTGHRVSACHGEDAARRWLGDLGACLGRGEAVSLLVRDDPLLPGGRYVELLLPLADEAGRPTLVLAYRHLPGG